MKRKLRRIKYLLLFGFVAGIIGGGVHAQTRDSELRATCASFRNGHAVLLGTAKPVQAQETPEKTEEEKVYEFGAMLFGDDWPTFLTILRCESGNKDTAISSTGDYGRAQINHIHGIPARWLKDAYVNLAVAHKLWEEQGATPWRSSYKCHGIR